MFRYELNKNALHRNYSTHINSPTMARGLTDLLITFNWFETYTAAIVFVSLF